MGKEVGSEQQKRDYWEHWLGITDSIPAAGELLEGEDRVGPESRLWVSVRSQETRLRGWRSKVNGATLITP